MDLTYGEIGTRVAKLLDRETPIRKQQVSSWFAGVIPNFQLGVALAQVLEVDPVELGMPGASRPLSIITPEDVDRATESVTGKRAAKKRRGGTGG